MLNPLEELGVTKPGSRSYPGYWNNSRIGTTADGWNTGIKVKDEENITADEFEKFRVVILESVRAKVARLANDLGPK